MGNSIGLKKKTAKVMKIDGTTFRLKSPVCADDILRDNPGYDLLESEEVKQLGLRARPMSPDRALRPGKLYFLVELPRVPDQRVPRRAWSGALNAKDRLESLKLTRRSVSDLTPATSSVPLEEQPTRVRMRLPKAQVARVVAESKDASEAAQKIMELCVARKTTVHTRRIEKRTRFVAMADEIIA